MGEKSKSQLYAGTSKVDITPVEEAFIVPNGGCAFRLPDNVNGEETLPKKVLDPICARVVVLKNEQTSVAIVSLDLILFSSKKVIDESKRKWKLDHVILSSTHTHSSMVPRGLCPTPKGWHAWEGVMDEPAALVDWPGFSEDPWYAKTEAKVVAAIGEAMKNLFPAHIVSGKGPSESGYMAHNRRLVGADGKVTAMWDNPKRLPTKPVDPTVGFIQINDDTDKPRAFLVHFACHPVGLMGSGFLSRDFPGAMVDYVERELGSDCMAMFLQGAQGDQDPYDMQLIDEQGFNVMRQAGISLGKGALRAANIIKTQQDKKNTSIEVKEDLVKIPLRNGSNVMDVAIMTVVINNDLALVSVPGEPFIQHQLDLTRNSSVANTFLLGIAYTGKGSPFILYIPTAQAVKEGGYGATANSFVAADAGEKIVAQALASIKELSVRFRPHY